MSIQSYTRGTSNKKNKAAFFLAVHAILGTGVAAIYHDVDDVVYMRPV